MNNKLKVLLVLLFLIISSCNLKEDHPKDYPIIPVPFTQVKVTDNFWAPRIRINSEVTIPIAFKHCETTGRVKNFEIAGGMAEGSFCTEYPFDDSDVYKIIEGASYALHVNYDPELDRYLDTLILKIAAAQEEDGYLYTNRTINPDSAHPWAGTQRWVLEHELSHELYNVGHLYEAAVAHYMATGKRSLLDVALKMRNSSIMILAGVKWNNTRVTRRSRLALSNSIVLQATNGILTWRNFSWMCGALEERNTARHIRRWWIKPKPSVMQSGHATCTRPWRMWQP